MSQRRRSARQFALQGLYQWQLNPQSHEEIEAQFQADEELDLSTCELAYFRELLREVPVRLDEIDGVLRQFLDRSPESLDPVEKAILRIGTYELMYRPEVPFRVVINEGVELAKRYGASEGYRYVNSVLDKVAKCVRSSEPEAVRTGTKRDARQPRPKGIG